MRRSFFLSVFFRIAIALVLFALVGLSSLPYRWILASLLVIAWAGISALFLSRSVRQDVTLLQNSAAAVPERHLSRKLDPKCQTFRNYSPRLMPRVAPAI